MTPDQYRREGFQAGIEAAANARGMWFGFNSSGEPTGEYCTVKAHDPGGMKLYISHGAIRAIDVDEVLAGLPTAPDPVARLVDAARALGAMPEGYCFCSANRVGDDSKIHEPECAGLRAALAAMEDSHD